MFEKSLFRSLAAAFAAALLAATAHAGASSIGVSGGGANDVSADGQVVVGVRGTASGLDLSGFMGGGTDWTEGDFDDDGDGDITDLSNHFLPDFQATGGGTYGPGQAFPEPSFLRRKS